MAGYFPTLAVLSWLNHTACFLQDGKEDDQKGGEKYCECHIRGTLPSVFLEKSSQFKTTRIYEHFYNTAQ